MRWVRSGVVCGLWVAMSWQWSRAAEPVTAFGLRMTPLGEATVALDGSGLPTVHLPTPPDSDRDGVLIELGEADAGFFAYPLTVDLQQGYSMRGLAYGDVGGVTNQLISQLTALRFGWGIYHISASFPGLGPSDVDFQLYKGRRLVASGRFTNEVAVLDNFYNGATGTPRANPFWRMRDGRVGALVELDYEGAFHLPGFEGPVYGNRLFMGAVRPVGEVAYVSRMEVYAGARADDVTFTSFRLDDGRLGMFRRPHRALWRDALVATNGLLTVRDADGGDELGVAIELDEATTFAGGAPQGAWDGASFFQAELVPLVLEAAGATFRLEAVGFVDGFYGWELGCVELRRGETNVQLTVDFSGVSQGIMAVVLRDGEIGGSMELPVPGQLSVEGVVGIGAGAVFANTLESPGGFSVGFDRVVTLTATNGQAFEGDEVRLLAVDAEAAKIAAVSTLVMEARRVSSFSITNEWGVGLEVPNLQVARSQSALTLSWPDPNEVLWVERALVLPGVFETADVVAVGSNNVRRVQLDPAVEGNGFFRLRGVSNEE